MLVPEISEKVPVNFLIKILIEELQTGEILEVYV